MIYKNEVIQKITDNTQVERGKVEKVFAEVFKVIRSEVSAGNEIIINGFGKFKVIEREERKGRNPLTGEEITIAAHKSPIFKASKAFKDAVN